MLNNIHRVFNRQRGADSVDGFEASMPESCAQTEELVEVLRTVYHKTEKKLEKCLIKKSPEEELRESLKHSADNLIDKSNLIHSVFEGWYKAEDRLCEAHSEIDNALKDKHIPAFRRLRDDKPFTDLVSQKKALSKAQEDVRTARRRADNAKSENMADMLMEVSSRQTVLRKAWDQYIQTLNLVQREKKPLCESVLHVMQDKLRYHRECAQYLEDALPALEQEVARITKESGPCFKVDIREHLQQTGRDIAYVLDMCTAALNRDDILNEEGLFRLSGPTSSVEKLKSFLDVMQAKDVIGDYDSGSVCSALKHYISSLPEPLLTRELLPEWSNACSLPTEDERRMALYNCCTKLKGCEPALYNNIRFLIKFLANVAKRSALNKMTAKNLGICLGPNMCPQDDSGLQGANLGTLLVECLVTHHEFCFGIEEPSFDSLPDNRNHKESHSDNNGAKIHNITNSGSVNAPEADKVRLYDAPSRPPAPSVNSSNSFSNRHSDGLDMVDNRLPAEKKTPESNLTIPSSLVRTSSLREGHLNPARPQTVLAVSPLLTARRRDKAPPPPPPASPSRPPPTKSSAPPRPKPPPVPTSSSTEEDSEKLKRKSPTLVTVSVEENSDPESPGLPETTNL